MVEQPVEGADRVEEALEALGAEVLARRAGDERTGGGNERLDQGAASTSWRTT